MLNADEVERDSNSWHFENEEFRIILKLSTIFTLNWKSTDLNISHFSTFQTDHYSNLILFYRQLLAYLSSCRLKIVFRKEIGLLRPFFNCCYNDVFFEENKFLYFLRYFFPPFVLRHLMLMAMVIFITLFLASSLVKITESSSLLYHTFFFNDSIYSKFLLVLNEFFAVSPVECEFAQDEITNETILQKNQEFCGRKGKQHEKCEEELTKIKL